MKRLYHNIDRCGCPRCGHRNFLVKSIESMLWLTNYNGEVCGCQSERSIYVGKCLECGKEFDVAPTLTGFMPITAIRKIVEPDMALESFGYIKALDDECPENPMEKVNKDGKHSITS